MGAVTRPAELSRATCACSVSRPGNAAACACQRWACAASQLPVRALAASSSQRYGSGTRCPCSSSTTGWRSARECAATAVLLHELGSRAVAWTAQDPAPSTSVAERQADVARGLGRASQDGQRAAATTTVAARGLEALQVEKCHVYYTSFCSL